MGGVAHRITRRPSPLGRQRGAVAITVGLALAILIGFLGLVVDLGHMYVAKAEMQNAMDACALAAAKELTGVSATQLQMAENAGITVGSLNNANFQSQAVAMTTADISFASAINGPYQSRTTIEAAGATQVLAMKFAKCEKAQTGINTYFMRVMGVGDQSVPAHAVATLQAGQTSCSIPLGMCAQNGATCAHGGVPNAYGLCPGEWYDGKFSSQSSLTGSFNWIDFSPPQGGASEAASLLSGTGKCNTNVTKPVGQPGAVGSLADEWNSRFGLYKNLNITSAWPDYSGYAYTPASWPTKFNAYLDFKTKRSANTPYQGVPDVSISNAYKNSTSQELASYGSSRRITLVPIVNCSGLVGSQQVPIQAWACVLMLHPQNTQGPPATIWMEFLGLSNDPNSPCATSGLPGSGAGPLVPALVR